MPDVAVIAKNVKTRFLDLVFPIFCALCGKEGALLCSACEPDFPLFISCFCPRCGKLTPGGRTCERCAKKSSLAGAFAVSSYANPVIRKIIGEWKYFFVRGWEPILTRAFKKAMLGIITLLPQGENITVMPVPLSRHRLVARGFNQSEILAKAAREALGGAVRDDFLARRMARRKPQAQMESVEERWKNAEGIFVLKDKIPISGDVILVDDVATSGATLEECARVLKSAGASAVWGLTLARG